MFLLVLAGLVFCPVRGAYREEFGARDRFWRRQHRERTARYKGVEQYDNIEGCLRDNRPRSLIRNRKEIKKRKIVNRLLDPVTEEVMLVEITDAITPEHAESVKTLAACIRRYIPGLTTSRNLYKEFGFEEDKGDAESGDRNTMGGNVPTFMAPLISMFLPEVVEGMQEVLEMAYAGAGWTAGTVRDEILNTKAPDAQPAPADVGIRTSEHLTYGDFPSLGAHTDGSTAYTINFALAGPEEYEGGEFFIIDNGNRRHVMKPAKYSCIAFLGGHYYHGVLTGTSGGREMFSTEYWAYPDTPFGTTLDNASPEHMEAHIEACHNSGDSCMANFGTYGGKEHYEGKYESDEEDEDEIDSSDDWEEDDKKKYRYGDEDDYELSDDWEEDGEEDEYELDKEVEYEYDKEGYTVYYEDEIDSSDDWDEDEYDDENDYKLHEGEAYKLDEGEEYELDEDEMDSSDDWDEDEMDSSDDWDEDELGEGEDYEPSEYEIDSSDNWDEGENWEEDDDYPKHSVDREEDEDDNFDYPTYGGDGERFARTPLAQGQIQPIRFESDQKMVSEHALRIGLPPELRVELKKFMEDYGIADAARRHLFSKPLDPESMTFQRLPHANSNMSSLFHIHRPGMYDMSDNTWFDPGNEVTHEEELAALGRGNFDAVLDALGKYYGLGNLTVYGMGIFALSMCAAGAPLHKDGEGTNLLNVLIGVELVDGADPEFVISDESGRLGEFKYEYDTGLVIGGDVLHGTISHDHRKSQGMRLVASVYIAEITDKNIGVIMDESSSLFPVEGDIRWMDAQRGRHWGNGNSLANDRGRDYFKYEDVDSDCKRLAEEGLCTNHEHASNMFALCPESCNVYDPRFNLLLDIL